MPAPGTLDCPIVTDPTGPQSLQLPDGSAYDAEAESRAQEPTSGTPVQTQTSGGVPELIVTQTLGAQSSPCVENPEPPRTVNNYAITGGQNP